MWDRSMRVALAIYIRELADGNQPAVMVRRNLYPKPPGGWHRSNAIAPCATREAKEDSGTGEGSHRNCKK